MALSGIRDMSTLEEPPMDRQPVQTYVLEHDWGVLSDAMRRELEDCMSECPCPTCQGRRLRKESLAVTVGGLDIDAFCRKSVTQALDFVDHLELTEVQMRIAERILKEYGQKHISTPLAKYYLLEHGETLLAEQAIKALAKTFR